jgi:ubiquinone/menaquinone biosynthesis C-methylase UbiE
LNARSNERYSGYDESGNVNRESSLKRVASSTVKAIAKTVYYNAVRLGLRTTFWWADNVGRQRSDVALPPAVLRFRVSESVSAPEFLRIGAGCANLIRQHIAGIGMDLANANRVLDFGCGCGRTIRWFLRDGGTAEFHGVDVDEDAIAWCKLHLRGGQFLANAPTPPLAYPDEYFDVVYCLSVFTHLSESMQNSWLVELKRILKPGGVLLLTVFGTAAAKHLDLEGKKRLMEVGFVHRRSKKLKGIVPDWYQTSWHSQEYIRNLLSRGFVDIQFRVIPDGLQDFVLARKTDHSMTEMQEFFREQGAPGGEHRRKAGRKPDVEGR